MTPIEPDFKANPSTSFDQRLRINALFEEDSDKYLGKEIKVCGWARNIREAEKGALCFIELYDGSIFNSV